MTDSAVTIIKNIFQFAKVLNQATTCDVATWDLKSVHNALSWTDYCEELSKHIMGKPFENDVNKQLEQMTSLLKPASCLTLTVRSLGSAQEMMVETLLINPHLPDTSKQELIKILKASERGAQVLEQVQVKLESSKTYHDVCLNLLTAVSDGDSRACLVEGLRSQQLKAQAEVLMESLSKTLNGCKNFRSFETYCTNICERLGGNSDGWAMMIHCVPLSALDSVPHEHQLAFPKICDIFMKWMKAHLKVDSLSSLLQKVKLSDFLKAAAASDMFCDLYQSALKLWVDDFHPVFEKGMLVWRCSTNERLSVITNLLHDILNLPREVTGVIRTETLHLIAHEVCSTDFTPWQEIAKHILVSFDL